MTGAQTPPLGRAGRCFARSGFFAQLYNGIKKFFITPPFKYSEKKTMRYFSDGHASPVRFPNWRRRPIAGNMIRAEFRATVAIRRYSGLDRGGVV
jgi:hypothetical protein